MPGAMGRLASVLTYALVAAALLLTVALLALHPRARALLKDGASLLRSLASDKRIPRPIRWLLIVALLPIPGPFEEVAGGLALGIIVWRYRGVLAEHRADKVGLHAGAEAGSPPTVG